MAGHFIVKCGTCGVVITQCRCISKDKPVSFETCDQCKMALAKSGAQPK